MRRFLFLGLAVLTIITSLSCCGYSIETDLNKSQQNTDADKIENKEQTINFYTLKTESRDFFKQLFYDFQKETGITVKDEYNANSYYTVLAAKIAAKEMPDIFTVFPDNKASSGIHKLGPKGYLLDITNEPFTREYLDSVNDQMKINGRIYSISCDIHILPVLYNKKLFKKAGIEKIPTDINEWWSLCEKLKAADITPLASNAKDQGWFFETTAIAPSVVFAKDMDWQKKRDRGEVKWNSGPWKNVFGILCEMQKKGYFIDKPLTRSYADSINMFAVSKTAMLVMGSWEFENITKIAGKGFEFGAFFFPGNEPGEKLVYPSSIGDLFAISASTERPEESKKLLAYFTKRNSDMQEAFGGFSTLRNGSANNLSPLLKDLLPEFERHKSYTFINNEWPTGFSGINTGMLITGETTIEQELSDTDIRFDQAVKEENDIDNH